MRIDRKAFSAVFAMMILVGVQSCGGGGGSSPTSTTTYEATIAGSTGTAGQSGTLAITIQAAVATPSSFSLIRSAFAQGTGDVTATGVLTLAGGGGTVDLSGTYCTTTGALNLVGGGYTFTGTIVSGVVSGTYTGSGSTAGGFIGLNSTTNTVTALCGTFTQDDHAISGVWNVVINSAGTLSGVAIEQHGGSSVKYLDGTLTGTAITITSDDGGHANGTLTGDSYTGTYVTNDGVPGTMQGSASGCQ